MSNTNVEKTASSKLNDFILKFRKVIIAVVAAVFAVVIIIAVAATVHSNNVEKGIEAVDSITYSFTKDAADISDEELAARQTAALDSLSSLTGKGGIVGIRANMLAADIYFQQQDWTSSRDAWLKAAELKKSSYTSPIAYYNAAVCSENLDDLDAAVQYYENAVNAEDFLLVDHAYFSLGRVNEEKGDFESANAAYESLVDLHPNNTWADLARSRMIAMKASGNIQ